MVPMAVVGAATHYRMGNVPRPGLIALPLTIGTAAGSFIGASTVAGKMDDAYLRVLFSTLIGGMGVKSLLK